MDTDVFILLPEMFPFPLFETTTATSYSRLWSLCGQREHSCANWRLFHMSSSLKWLFSIIANPTHLMNNLGCDRALPDGWDEMPPLAFRQLGEVVIPTGWSRWLWSFWGAHKYPWVMYSFWSRPESLVFLLTPHSMFVFFHCIHTGSSET